MTSPQPYRRGPQAGSTSQYKGVSWKRKSSKWQAAGRIGRRTKYLGLFESELDAARAYDTFALETYGYGSFLNFPLTDDSAEPKRQCNRCGAVKPTSAFDQGRTRCKTCRSAAARASAISNAETVLDNHLRRKFGITLADYNALLVDQRGCCAVCGCEPTGLARLVVDHCHSSGRVRGLLCRPCNSGIGHLRDDAAVVRAALKYLEERS